MNNPHMSKVALSDIVERLPDFYVLKIDQIANRLIQEGRDVIKLNLGKSEVPMPRYVSREMVRNIYDKKRREIIDPQGVLPLREEIARDYYESTGARIHPDQVFINNGTSPFFLSLFLLLANKGEEILLPKPYYPTYVASANIAGLTKRFYGIVNGRIDMRDVRREFKPGVTKIVFLNSPGNPLGNVHTRDEIADILNLVNGRAYVISDEIYDGFVYDTSHTSALNVCDPVRDKAVILNGFSKIHHMYTRRLGYAIVPFELIGPLTKFQQHTVVCVDPITQFAGLAALRNKKRLIRNEVQDEVSKYAKRMKKSGEIMSDTRLKLIRPRGSFYMCVDVSEYLNKHTPHSLALAQKLLEGALVAVTPAEDFGMNNFFRVSLTSSRLIEGVRRLRVFFRSL